MVVLEKVITSAMNVVATLLNPQTLYVRKTRSQSRGNRSESMRPVPTIAMTMRKADTGDIQVRGENGPEIRNGNIGIWINTSPNQSRKLDGAMAAVGGGRANLLQRKAGTVAPARNQNLVLRLKVRKALVLVRNVVLEVGRI
jgi:hypothetical protein